MWLTKTCQIVPSAEGFALFFHVLYQPKKISVQSMRGTEISAIPQYGCYTFAFHKNLPCLVAVSKNKWANDWSSHWFYHKVALDPVTKTHPLVIDHIPALGDVPKVASRARAEDEVLLALLRKLSETFGTWDLIEEFIACGCFPIRAGWTISSWLTEDRWIEGISIPDFVTIFSLRADREFSFLVSIFEETNAPLCCLRLVLLRPCRS
jgi:hypothetical protein